VVTLDTGTFVYGAAFGSDQVYGYQVQDDGTLSSVPGSPFSTGHTPVGLTTVQDMVLVVGQGDGTVSAFKAQDDGSLLAAPGSPFDARAGAAFNCAADPSGRFLYVGNEAAPLVYAFRVNPADASLSLLPESPFRASMSDDASFVVSGPGKITYIFSDMAAPNGQPFRRKSSGALVPARKPFDVGFPDVNVGAMDPAGKLVALAGTRSGTVGIYRINAGSGGLKSVGSQFETFQNVNGIVFVGN
jgi:6-phosphogluconolactonase (cycloisomerase 2 family)